MFQKLYRLMENYSAYPLMLSAEDVKPGMCLETKWGWWGKPDKFIKEEGFAWKLLSQPACPCKPKSASIIVGDITGKVAFGMGLALPQYGFKGDASFARQTASRLKIGAIKVISFVDGWDAHKLRRELRELRDSDPAVWSWVDDDFLVTDSYYTADLVYEFKEDGDFNAKAEYDGLGNSISAGFEAHWEGDSKFILIGTAKAPFAVRGVKV